MALGFEFFQVFVCLFCGLEVELRNILDMRELLEASHLQTVIHVHEP